MRVATYQCARCGVASIQEDTGGRVCGNCGFLVSPFDSRLEEDPEGVEKGNETSVEIPKPEGQAVYHLTCRECQNLSLILAADSPYCDSLYCKSCGGLMNLEGATFHPRISEGIPRPYPKENRDPEHYSKRPLEPIEKAVIEGDAEPFIFRNLVKYIDRHKMKNGAADIRKAAWCLGFLGQLWYGESFAEALERGAKKARRAAAIKAAVDQVKAGF